MPDLGHLRHCANRAERKFNTATYSVDQRYRAEMSLGGSSAVPRGPRVENATRSSLASPSSECVAARSPPSL